MMDKAEYMFELIKQAQEQTEASAKAEVASTQKRPKRSINSGVKSNAQAGKTEKSFLSKAWDTHKNVTGRGAAFNQAKKLISGE